LEMPKFNETNVPASEPGQPIYQNGNQKYRVGDDANIDEYLPTTEKAWVFHLLMISASMYMAMLLSDWGTPSGASNVIEAPEGAASMWVKFVAALTTVFLYGWTLIAPGVMHGRTFNLGAAASPVKPKMESSGGAIVRPKQQISRNKSPAIV